MEKHAGTSPKTTSELTIFDRRVAAAPPAAPAPGDRLVLPFHLRQKGRQRARLASGREVGLQMPRGTVLRGGDLLEAATGERVVVVAEPERVSTASTHDRLLLARAAYHLGNRHVHLEVGAGWVRYLHDHVLDEMVEALGLTVLHDLLPFEPEAGAYSHGH